MQTHVLFVENVFMENFFSDAHNSQKLLNTYGNRKLPTFKARVESRAHEQAPIHSRALNWGLAHYISRISRNQLNQLTKEHLSQVTKKRELLHAEMHLILMLAFPCTIIIGQHDVASKSRYPTHLNKGASLDQLLVLTQHKSNQV